MDKLKLVEQTLMKDEIPDFRAGDTVNVHYRVREGEKERIQKIEGVVLSRSGSGANETFVVRKISAGNIGVERTFPLHSPFIAKVEVKKRGDVRRSKLYYLRERRGKAARIRERDREQPFASAEPPAESEAESVSEEETGQSKEGGGEEE